MLKRTPCIGICSTTYGDLVCRGCKRFAHEIAQWNGFEEAQREAVRERLLGIRRGAVQDVLQLVDDSALRGAARSLGITEWDVLEPLDLAYEVLRRARQSAPDPADMGIIGRPGESPERRGEGAARALLERIDREFYQRSIAYYERSFRTLAQ